MKHTLIFTLLFFLSFIPLAASEEAKVSVEIDKNEVVLGDAVHLIITVEGMTPNAPPELPEIPDFTVRYLGSRTESFSSVTVVIQGKKAEEQRSGGGTQYEYALVPKAVGTYPLPRFTFILDGKSYTTSDTYTIRVVDIPETEEDIFLRISVDKEAFFLGESVLLTFEWYFDKDIQDYSLTIPWFGALKEFLVEDPEQDPNKQYAQLIINDKDKITVEKKSVLYQEKRYTVLRFQKILTPISAGRYALDPSFLRAEIVKGYVKHERRSVIPFFRYYSDLEDLFGLGKRAVTQQLFTKSRPVTLTVKPLPEENRPPTFTGAVGSFDFQVNVAPQSVKKGDSVTVTMKVVGTGNFNEVQLPEFPELSAFKGYTPEIKTDTSQADGMVIGEKTFAKVLVSRREGKYEIPPLSFSFFDPTDGQYKTIARGPFPIEIQPGASEEETPQIGAGTPAPVRRGKEIKIITHDIRYIKTDLGTLKRPVTPLYKIPLFWFFGFVPLPLAAAVSFVIQKRRLRFRTDTAYARRAQAFKNAEEMLTACTHHLREGNAGEFYSDLSKSISRFLADKLNCPIGTLPQELIERVKGKSIKEALVADLERFFDQMDLVRYSKASGDIQQRNEMLESAKTLLSRLEKVI